MAFVKYTCSTGHRTPYAQESCMSDMHVQVTLILTLMYDAGDTFTQSYIVYTLARQLWMHLYGQNQAVN